MEAERVSESEVEEGGGRAGEEREVCIHVGGNRGIYSSAHTQRQEERDERGRMLCKERGRKTEKQGDEGDRGSGKDVRGKQKIRNVLFHEDAIRK